MNDDRINQGIVYEGTTIGYTYDSSGRIGPIDPPQQRTNMIYDTGVDEPTIIDLKPKKDPPAESA